MKWLSHLVPASDWEVFFQCLRKALYKSKFLNYKIEAMKLLKRSWKVWISVIQTLWLDKNYAIWKTRLIDKKKEKNDEKKEEKDQIERWIKKTELLLQLNFKFF